MPKYSVIARSASDAAISFFTLVILLTFIFIPTANARTTPEDIVNAQKEAYEQRTKNYSVTNKQKLLDWEKKIEVFNDERSAELDQIMQTHAAILDEFIRRSEQGEKLATDGKTRNLSDPIENARYWLTYAHEAVAYQAAKVYVFNTTGESAINQNILSTITTMNADLNVLRAKVQKSQTIM